MVGAQTNIINASTTIQNNVLQSSVENCTISCGNNFNYNTLIVIGGSGDINISQSCKVDSSTCQLKASFDSSIQSIIDNIIAQSASAQSGFSFDFSVITQDVNINSIIQNSITQLMSSSCAITSSNNKNSNYILIADRDGNIDLSQTGVITSSTCAMDNIAKAATYSQVTNDATQKSSITNIFALFFIGFIVLIIVMGVVLVAFVVTGGANRLISAAADTSKQGMQTLADNPQLAAALL